MIPRRKHNASSGSLPPPDDKHASNDYILSDGSAREGWRAALRRRCTRKTLRKRLPIAGWLPQYGVQQAVGDAIAGVTVGLTVIPQSLAYANIAGLPPQHGLYGSFLGCFVYIVLGGCRAVPAGPTAIASLLTWQVAGGVLPKAILLNLLTGLVELLMGALGLGFLVNFVSGPVSSGFTSAVALMIATSQVKDLFAIPVSGTTFLQQWISIFRNIRGAALWDPVLGFSCIALLLSMRKIGMVKLGADRPEGPNARQKVLTKLLWLLGTCRNALVVVAGGALGFAVAARGSAPVRLMGAIPAGVPAPALPALSYVRADNSTADFLDMVSELGSGLLVIPLIVLLEDIAICKAFSDGRTIDATQEMIALGLANVANSFVQAFPGGGSLARSVVSNGSGVRTPLNGLYTGVIVIVALQFCTQYFEYIPKASLAAVIISAILFMVEYDVVKPMWRAKKLDLIPGIGTFVLCLTLPIELGILTGVVVNIVFILYHAARPKFSVEILKTEAGVEYLMITPDRCLMFPSVDYVRRLVTKSAAGGALPVVLECTHIYSADYTAAKSIEQLTADFHARRQPLYFYNVKPSVCSIFEAVTKPEHFTVFYEDDELDRLLAADPRLHAAKPPPPPGASPA
ncbi:sodium-independent sulfate anion transporter-like [Maniola jurtina]|uniref:sodium-independent sulfate anion transporter-like n=1 Tax=Maniola jurtina TaxID=191418 RepID=UPI001E687850|nr:sodium-independent sulfate anion transporter-like [Maniola jurtina]XP_045771326.1 sodium-independent sulfate anion transporter-like [Maniola jurtina]